MEAKQNTQHSGEQWLQSGGLTMQAGSGAAQKAGNVIKNGVRVALILHSTAALSDTFDTLLQAFMTPDLGHVQTIFGQPCRLP